MLENKVSDTFVINDNSYHIENNMATIALYKNNILIAMEYSDLPLTNIIQGFYMAMPNHTSISLSGLRLIRDKIKETR